MTGRDSVPSKNHSLQPRHGRKIDIPPRQTRRLRIDLLYKSRQLREHANRKSRHRAEIHSVFIPIQPPWFIKMIDIEIRHPPHDEIIRQNDPSEGSQKDGIAIKKGEEPRGAGFDFPGTDGECQDGGDVLASSDGEVAWEERHDVVTEGHRVAGDDVADVCEGEEEAGEEFGGAVVPDLDHFELSRNLHLLARGYSGCK